MTIFLNYSSGSERYLDHFQRTLKRIQRADPIIAERIGEAGNKVDSKLERMLKSSHCMVSLLTSDTLRDGTWQREEIGYFKCLGRPMIPMAEEGFPVFKGFLGGTEVIWLRPNDLDYNSYELIRRLRQIVRGLWSFWVTCSGCNGKFSVRLPPQSQIDDLMQTNLPLLVRCPKCPTNTEVSMKSLESMKMHVEPASQIYSY